MNNRHARNRAMGHLNASVRLSPSLTLAGAHTCSLSPPLPLFLARARPATAHKRAGLRLYSTALTLRRSNRHIRWHARIFLECKPAPASAPASASDPALTLPFARSCMLVFPHPPTQHATTLSLLLLSVRPSVPIGHSDHVPIPFVSLSLRLSIRCPLLPPCLHSLLTPSLHPLLYEALPFLPPFPPTHPPHRDFLLPPQAHMCSESLAREAHTYKLEHRYAHSQTPQPHSHSSNSQAPARTRSRPDRGRARRLAHCILLPALASFQGFG